MEQNELNKKIMQVFHAGDHFKDIFNRGSLTMEETLLLVNRVIETPETREPDKGFYNYLWNRAEEVKMTVETLGEDTFATTCDIRFMSRHYNFEVVSRECGGETTVLYGTAKIIDGKQVCLEILPETAGEILTRCRYWEVEQELEGLPDRLAPENLVDGSVETVWNSGYRQQVAATVTLKGGETLEALIETAMPICMTGLGFEPLPMVKEVTIVSRNGEACEQKLTPAVGRVFLDLAERGDKKSL